MNLHELDETLQKLQIQSVGNPLWIKEKNVYEYSEKCIEVVVILKLVRAAHGLHSMDILCKNGLFIDMSAIWRCVIDSTNEIYFLLEKYPEKSSNVEKFIIEFFSKTIDNYLSTEEEPVANKKILNAYSRVLSGKEQDEKTKQAIYRIYKTNSGYIHASYSHIMEMFGGLSTTFNHSGIPSQSQIIMRMEIVESAYISVSQAMAFTAQRFSMVELYEEIKKLLTNSSS